MVYFISRGPEVIDCEPTMEDAKEFVRAYSREHPDAILTVTPDPSLKWSDIDFNDFN